MHTNKLQGLSILVTRPKEAGVLLRDALQHEGAAVSLFPTIDFTDPPSFGMLIDGLKQLADQDWIIFVSPQAVERFVMYTDQYKLCRTFSARLAAMGDGTVRALEKVGMRNILYTQGEATSEALLALPEFQSVAKKRITIVRGLNGREMLDSAFKERGAAVLTLITYQRVLPKVDASGVIVSLKQKQIHVILCSSFDSVANLSQLVGDHRLLADVPLIVMSERVKALASQLGFVNVWVVNVAKHEQIMQFLYEKRNQLCQMNNIKR